MVTPLENGLRAWKAAAWQEYNAAILASDRSYALYLRGQIAGYNTAIKLARRHGGAR